MIINIFSYFIFELIFIDLTFTSNWLQTLQFIQYLFKI